MPKTIAKYGDRTRKPFHTEGDSMTRQSFVQETIIENILAKYRQTGTIPHQMRGEPQYGNVMNSMDYKEATDQLIEVQDHFDALTSDQRKQYGNDPLQFLEAIENGTFSEPEQPKTEEPPQPEIVPDPVATPPRS